MENWRSKHYGRLTGHEIEQMLAGLRIAWSERLTADDFEVGSAQWHKAVERIACVPSWVPFYQIPLPQLLATIFVAADFVPTLEEAAASDRPASFLMSAMDDLPDEPPVDPTLQACLIAMIGNLEAIARYSRSINDMFEAAKQGDESALFDALSIDSHVSALPGVQAMLRLGQFAGDSSLALEVFKAIRGPHKKRLDYPELRWAEYLLRDQGAFEACTREEIYELVAIHLNLYDPDASSRDPKAGLFKLFRSWQREAGIQNPRFGFSAKPKK